MPIIEGWVVHEVRKGETLSGIAARYGTTVDALWSLDRNGPLRERSTLDKKIDYEDNPSKPPVLVFIRQEYPYDAEQKSQKAVDEAIKDTTASAASPSGEAKTVPGPANHETHGFVEPVYRYMLDNEYSYYQAIGGFGIAKYSVKYQIQLAARTRISTGLAEFAQPTSETPTVKITGTNKDVVVTILGAVEAKANLRNSLYGLTLGNVSIENSPSGGWAVSAKTTQFLTDIAGRKYKVTIRAGAGHLGNPFASSSRLEYQIDQPDGVLYKFGLQSGSRISIDIETAEDLRQVKEYIAYGAVLLAVGAFIVVTCGEGAAILAPAIARLAPAL